MKQIAAGIVLLTLTAPALAGHIATVEERIAREQAWVDTMEWVDVCTTGRGWRFSEAERFKVCVAMEQGLRNEGRCMYVPGVIGTWDGKHCR